jgi:iron complex transport system substrate-binding protein
MAAILAGIAPARAAPPRIVSVFLCTDEYVFRLVPKDRIAALSVLAGDTHPVVSTIADKVGGIPLVRASAEAVLAKHPDLVVMYKGTNPRLRALVTDAGVKILDVPWATSLADVRRITLMLGDALGASARARAMLKAMDTKLAAARAAAPHRPVSALIYEPNGYVTADAVSDAILAAGGLRNAAGALRQTRLGRIPVEAVVAAAPRLLILNASREGGPALADAALRHPALAALKGRALIVRASLTPLLCPGPWSADAAGEFARLARHAAQLAMPRAGH